MQKNKKDIVELILDDHKSLKALINILLDPASDDTKRFLAFEKFSPLLHRHAIPEEQSLYEFMKTDESLQIEALEGETAHAIADQLIHEIYDLEDKKLWNAKVRELAQTVKQHISDEEEQVLPHFTKHTDQKTRADLGARFLKLKEDTTDGLPLVKVLAEEIYIEQGKNH